MSVEPGRDWVGRRLASSLLSTPWWPEVVKWRDEVGGERVEAPMLFSTMAGAAEQLRELYDVAADECLRLGGEHGVEEVNEAYDNTPPTMKFFLDAETLLDNLEDSDFPSVRFDGRMMLRQDFVEGLRR